MRKWRHWGWLMVAFGAGLLIGQWAEGGFLFHCFGIGLIAFGGLLICK